MQTSKVLMRQLAIEHQGGQERYQSFRKMVEASPLLYKHDLDVYTDQISERHIRNIAELRYIQQLIRDNKIGVDMLSTNVYNTYYPSYVLCHHYSVFSEVVKRVKQRQGLQEFYGRVRRNEVTGAFLGETRRIDMKEGQKCVPVINWQGNIEMDENVYFYSLVSSPYITHAAFLGESNEGKVLVIVEIRNKQGQFSEHIKYRDLGGLISKDYLPIGYNFSNTRPLFVIPVDAKISKKMLLSKYRQEISEFNFSLKDFQKSLWLTIRYTSMRRQFKTIEGSRQQRKIITYQAVAARIINAFAQFQAFSDLYARMLQNPRGDVLYGQIVKSAHHCILDHLIHLRQCCGGFGYLQFSGHPGCIERLCARSGRESQSYPEGQLNLFQFYAGNKEVIQWFTQEITEKEIPYMKYLSVFLSITKNMKENKEKISALEFRRQFLRQVSILSMHSRQQFLRHESDNVHFQLLQYHMLGYIAKNAAFIDWGHVKIQKKDLFDHLRRQRAVCFDNIVGKLDSLCRTLELTFLRNTIVGREDSQQFYSELIAAQRSNRRNSKEYVDYIREPVIEMLTGNRAKL